MYLKGANTGGDEEGGGRGGGGGEVQQGLQHAYLLEYLQPQTTADTT